MSGSIRDIMRDKPAKRLPAIPTDQKVKRVAEPVADIADDSQEDSFEADSCAVTVAVRMRPFAQREVSDPRNRRIVSMEGTETIVKATETSQVHKFQYDYSFDSFDSMSPGFSSQKKVYQSLAQPLLNRAFQGYNTCLFAYGQTGSGKSYSIMGHRHDDGIIPRFSDELFQKIESLKENSDEVTAVNVETSFFEIYNEKIHDLLAMNKSAQSSSKQNLKVREHPDTGPYVEGLSTFPVASYADIQRLLTLGNRQRATASTGMNDKSSRSHSVFTINLNQIKSMDFEETQHEHSVVSRINLVDLAGSERQSSAQTSGVRLKEGASINRSLLTLGKVISVLAEQSSHAKKRKLFVPYRDSVLTWLLRESLGGNARTAMIATISPSSLNLEETLSTLRYAQQARSIVNLAKVNEDPKARLIRELRAEIARLRSEQGDTGGVDDDVSTMQEILGLRKALQEKESDFERLQCDWQQKLKSAEEKMRQENSFLEHTGVAASSINNKLPNLVNLNEDPQLSEVLLYVLSEGQTKVGRQGASQQKPCDIQLSGALVADYHCSLLNDAGQVSITPIDKEAPTFVNGQQITHSVTLSHGDRVIIGGDHYFRFNHPASVSVSTSTKRTSSGVPKDFQFAKAEIEKTQNDRLESERQNIQRELEEQMTEQLHQVETSYNQRLLDQKSEYESQIRRIHSDLLRQKTQSPVKVDSGQPNMPSAERLLSTLQAEKLKLTESHARLKPKLKSAKHELAVKSIANVPTANIFSTERGKTDLYKVALLIREANKLSQLKSMPTTYTQEEVDNVIVIKVTDTEYNRCAYLTVAKFEERLADMREALENNDSHDESVVVFCNPSDSWKQTNNTTPQQAPSLDEILNSENKVTPMEQVINAPPNIPLPSSSTSHHQGSAKVRQRSSSSLYNMCKDFVSYSLQKHKATNTGARKIFDSILRQCELCRIAVTSLVTRAKGHKSDSQPAVPDDEITGACCLQLVTSSEVLLEQCQLCCSMCEDIDSNHITDIVSKMSDTSFKISRLIIQLMQAMSSEAERCINDHSTNLIIALLEICKLCGVMSLTTDTTISLQSNAFLQLSHEVQMACARGSLEQCLYTAGEKHQSATQSIDYILSGSQASFASEAIYDAVLKVVRKVERFLTEYQEEANNTLNSIEKKKGDFDPCHRYDICSQAVLNLNTIGDSLSALTKPMFTQGKEYDRAIILKAADTIKRCCRKLALDTSIDLTSLVGVVSLLFAVTEAEGKVKVRHKSSQSQSVSESDSAASSPRIVSTSASHRAKRLLPQVSSNDKARRVLPPSPESQASLSPFTKSPPKTVSKLTAMFETPKKD